MRKICLLRMALAALFCVSFILSAGAQITSYADVSTIDSLPDATEPDATEPDASSVEGADPETPPEILPEMQTEILSDIPPEILPLEDGAYSVVIGSGADDLLIPLNTRSTRSKDDHGGDWALNWDEYYYPWIGIVDENGQQVSDAYIEVSWNGPFYFNWYRSGEMVLYDGRLLIQQVEPTNWRAIESGDVTFNFTIKSWEDDEVLGTCSAGPVHVDWDWGPWIHVDSGLDDLTIPADTWSAGSHDSHGGNWATGADYKFYPSVRILDGNGFAVEEEITVSWNGDFLINGKQSGELRLAEGDLMIYSIEPTSGILPEESSEILLSFSFKGAGREYRFDDVGPIRVNWAPSIVDEDDSESGPYWVYIDGYLDRVLDLTVPTRSWSTASYDSHGGWWSSYGGLYCPTIWVTDSRLNAFWADVTVYWDGPFRINGSPSGDLRFSSSQLIINSIMPLQGAPNLQTRAVRTAETAMVAILKPRPLYTQRSQIRRKHKIRQTGSRHSPNL